VTRRAGFLALAAGLLVSLAVHALYLWPPTILARADQSVYDLFLGLMHTGATSGRTVIVDIDEQSLSEFGRWPWPRSQLARLLDAIRAQGAAGVALGMMFPEHDDPTSDQKLADVLRAPIFVVGYAFTFGGQGTDEKPCVLHPVSSVARSDARSGNRTDQLFRATGAVCNVAIISEAASGSGFVNAAPDDDGIFRRVPQLVEYDGRVYPSLALAVLMRVLDAHPVTVDSAGPDARSLRVGAASAPLDRRANLLLHFRGGRRTFPYVSASQILSGRLAAGSLRDKIVFLETSALGIRRELATPVDPLFPAVEVHATVVDNLITGDAFARPGWASAVEMALILVLGVGTASLVAWMRPGVAALLVTLAGIVVWLATAQLFHAARLVISPLFPSIALGGSLTVVAMLNVLIERQRSAASHRTARELLDQVDERRRREEAAREANRAKSEFLSRMSHELRTPLNAILGFGQLLELDATSEDQRESAEQIVKAGRHLLALIDEVLDISRIEAGRLRLTTEVVPVAGAIRQCLSLVGPLVQARKIELRAEGVDHRWSVLADRKRLDQVLLNLVSNAVKYNREHGTVTVTAERPARDRLRLHVIDTGQGIAADKLSLVFTPFERLGAERSAVQGTGLGLAVTKQLVEAMGGSIHVTSVLGEGSTFTVELALADPAAPGSEMTNPEDRAGSHPSSIPLTVLYAEDDPSNVRLMEGILLRRPGIRLVVASNGGAALELAQKHQPDLVLLDRHLPDMTGDEVLKRLLSDPQTKQAAVVFVSADATADVPLPLLTAGARAYLTKPVYVAEVLSLLDEIAAKKATSAI